MRRFGADAQMGKMVGDMTNLTIPLVFNQKDLEGYFLKFFVTFVLRIKQRQQVSITLYIVLCISMTATTE